ARGEDRQRHRVAVAGERRRRGLVGDGTLRQLGPVAFEHLLPVKLKDCLDLPGGLVGEASHPAVPRGLVLLHERQRREVEDLRRPGDRGGRGAVGAGRPRIQQGRRDDENGAGEPPKSGEGEWHCVPWNSWRVNQLRRRWWARSAAPHASPGESIDTVLI